MTKRTKHLDLTYYLPKTSTSIGQEGGAESSSCLQMLTCFSDLPATKSDISIITSSLALIKV